MKRTKWMMVAMGLLVVASGCRSRCYNPCGGGGYFAGSPTIAPAPTYSLNIPSVARNQPYYVPNQNGAVNPAAAAPTPATGGANRWEPKRGTAPQPNGSVGGRSVLTQGTTFVETTPPTSLRTASAAPLPGTGVSYTDSTNYRTTRIDETNDQTRIAATDASQVRAPARSYPTGNVNRIARLPRSPAPGYPVNNRGVAASPTYIAPFYSGTVASTQPVYRGTPLILGGQTQPAYPPAYNSGVVYTGQPYAVPRQTGSPAVFVAESTAQYTPVPGGTQVDWRNRDVNASSDGYTP